MLRARKSKLISWMFHLVQQRYLKQYFSKILVFTAEPIRSNALFIANHSSWWDGLLFFQLEKRRILPPLYMMTHEEGMRKVPIFKWLGAFSVNPQKPKHIIETLRYSQFLLENNKSVTIFPQGAEYHLEFRPFIFQHGAAYIANKCPTVPVIPVTIYYSFRHTKKGEAWIYIGRPISHEAMTKQKLTKLFEDVVTAQIDTLKQDVIHNQFEKYNNIL